MAPKKKESSSLSGGVAEAGVTYPRDLDVSLYEGLPEGWRAVESCYLSGTCLGQTYVRFKGPVAGTSSICTVKAAIRKDAIVVKGLSEAEASRLTEEYETREKEKMEKKRKEREEQGLLEGAAREEAVNAFRAQYGPLDGATVSKIPGWTATSIFREACQQTAVTYYSPEGRAYNTVKGVECLFGVRVLKGLTVDEIDVARSLVVRDESGKVVNEFRANVTETLSAEASIQNRKSRKRSFKLIYGPECYDTCQPLHMLKVSTSAEWAPTTIPKEEVTPLRDLAANMCTALTARGFAEGMDIHMLRGCQSGHQLEPWLNGFFYEMPSPFNDRPAFQKVSMTPHGKLACTPLYIYWSPTKEWWAIGRLGYDARAVAFAKQDVQVPFGAEVQWMVMNDLGLAKRAKFDPGAEVSTSN